MRYSVLVKVMASGACVLCLLALCLLPGRLCAQAATDEDPEAVFDLPGYESTKRGVTGPDGRAMSGYTWEMLYQDRQERAKAGISVMIDGDRIEFPDQAPVMIDGRVLTPMRAVFESAKVQCRVSWDEQSCAATVLDQRGRKTVFVVGQPYYTVVYPEGTQKTYPLDVPATIIDGRVMLPLRAPLETFQYKVDWINDSQTIYVYDRHPDWRKLASPAEWAALLQDECLPCTLTREAR